MSRIVRFYDFELDPKRRLLRKAGQLIKIPSKTLDILLVLVERRGEVVGKTELIEAAWPNTFVEEVNLHVHVSALRKLLGEKPTDHRFIVTIPREGYRFVAEVEEPGQETGPAPAPAIRAGRGHRAVYGICGVLAILIAAAAVGYTGWSAHRQVDKASGHRIMEPYWRGVHFWNQRTPDALRRSVHYFDLALEQDATLVPALAARADALALLALDSETSQRREELFSRARASAEAALALEQDSVLAQVALALISTMHDRDAEHAERLLDRALAIEPNHALANQRFAWLRLAREDPVGALRHIEVAVGEGPASATNNAAFCVMAYLARRFPLATERCRAALELEPDNLPARSFLAASLLTSGDRQGAIEELQWGLDATSQDVRLQGAMGHALAVQGQVDEAERILERLGERLAQDKRASYAMALVHSGLGNRAAGLESLALAVRDRATPPIPFWLDPRLEGFGDRRMREIVETLFPPGQEESAGIDIADVTSPAD